MTRFSRSRWWMLPVVVGWLWVAVPAGAETPRLQYSPGIELPRELQDRVRFWVDVFTRYTLGEAVVYDRAHPSRVLAVVPMKTGRTREIRQISKRYRGLIDEVTAAEEFRVAPLLAHFTSPIDPKRIREAASGIRVQPGQREVLEKSVRRSRQYLPMMRRVMEEMGVPPELAYLPHVESSFNEAARSRRGAVGIWQLMPATARHYIQVNRHRDERRNPEKATRAAARYLKDAYDTLGSWPLAVTAYNYGVNGMARAVESLDTTHLPDILAHHESPSFGFACKNFYAQFLAAAHVAENQAYYFPDLGQWQIHVVRKGDTLWEIAKSYGTTVKALRSANQGVLARSPRRLRLGQKLVITG